MRLLTELRDRMNENGKAPVFNEPGMRPERAFAHDAVAAHALLRAINDWHEKNGTGPDEDVYPHATVAWLENRAAELMREWGYQKVTP